MMRLRIVKSAINEVDKEDDEDNIPYGKKFLKEIVLPRDKTDRIVCADSSFASLPASE